MCVVAFNMTSLPRGEKLFMGYADQILLSTSNFAKFTHVDVVLHHCQEYRSSLTQTIWNHIIYFTGSVIPVKIFRATENLI